jgi:mRNA-degrading endonuclease RelE of RelBE toxin-antitoxin system
MSAYELKIAASAARTIARLPESAAAAIIELMTGPLIENPRRVGKPLELDLQGYLSARRGAYRVICRVENERIVRVVRIDHRADVYRAL